MRLLLLRHGQTHSNVIGALDTAVPGAPLNELGLRQAAAVPRALVGQEIDAISASTIVRTQQTAEPLAADRGITVAIRDGLREISAGSLEMLSDHESQGVYTATAFAWAKGDLELRMPGGESGHEFFQRYDAAIRDVLDSRAKVVVAVSHGAAIRTWVAARCDNTDGGFAGTHQLDNTGVAVLEGDRVHDWHLVEWQSTPLGGTGLADARAVDPTGEALE
ncbi:MAG TPA: histidine phosphatase family protein [Galbitalea sp.]